MKRNREIYRAGQLPVFQNQMFHSEQVAKNCIKGDVVLVQDLETGLIFNQAFRPELMQYDADYETFEKLASGHCEAHVLRGNHFDNQLVMRLLRGVYNDK